MSPEQQRQKDVARNGSVGSFGNMPNVMNCVDLAWRMKTTRIRTWLNTATKLGDRTNGKRKK